MRVWLGTYAYEGCSYERQKQHRDRPKGQGKEVSPKKAAKAHRRLHSLMNRSATYPSIPTWSERAQRTQN